MTLDGQDTTTAPYFLAQLRYFTNQHAGNPVIIEPRIYRINELVASKALNEEIGQSLGLLDIYDEDDGSDSGDEDALQSMQHLTTYWYPKEGDIKILNTAVAESVASLTGCSIYPEPQESRVRLVNGDFTLALKKLQNIEPLLVSRSRLGHVHFADNLQALQHQQRSFNTTRANANILLATSDELSPSMRFWPVADPSRPFLWTCYC